MAGGEMGGCRKEGSQPHRARRSIDLASIPSIPSIPSTTHKFRAILVIINELDSWICTHLGGIRTLFLKCTSTFHSDAICVSDWLLLVTNYTQGPCTY